MSLRNTDNLMASMLSRASSVSFQPMEQMQRPQFNPVTGSWVFGLAAFVAGVAINKVMKPGENAPAPQSPSSPPPSSSRPVSNRRPIAPAPHAEPVAPQDYFREGSMRDLLRDTMEEESRSGDYLSDISSQVAKLREEVAALSSQKEQIRTEERVHTPNVPQAPSVSQHRPIISDREFEEMRDTISQLNSEKEKLARKEAELNHALATQRSDRNSSDFAGELAQVQSELTKLQSEQQRILADYESSKHEAKEARSVMNDLKLLLDEKIAKLGEAEVREERLRNEHQELMTTVENLKTQLEFFRSRTRQDQSGVTSLKILEESNSKLVEQVNSTMQETELQQATLKQLSAEKVDLLKQLDSYKEQAKHSEHQMEKLEKALSEAKAAETALLSEVERLSAKSKESTKNKDLEVEKLENDLADARNNISDLESKEASLLAKLHHVENVAQKDATLKDDQLNSVKAERDELQQALNTKDHSYKKLEANYLYKIEEAEDLSGKTKTDLVIAAEKEEELNDKIKQLVGKISKLENERDLYKSKSEIEELKFAGRGNEYTVLKQTILTLESEKKSLSNELDRFRSEAKDAEEKIALAESRIKESLDQEKIYKEEIEQIKSGISNQQQLYGDYTAQQNELAQAKQEIQKLIDAKTEKDRELEDARKDLVALDAQVVKLSQRSADVERDEKGASKHVALIQSQLSERDSFIASAKIREDGLRREVATLKQTSENLSSELDRISASQAGLSATSASMNILKETENQLKQQIQIANKQIESQHSKLIEAENAKVQLEANYREESMRLAVLQNENEALKKQLNEWQSREGSKATVVNQLSADVDQHKELELEYNRISQRQAELKVQLDQARNQEAKLKQSLSATTAELERVVSERDELQRQLNTMSKDLRIVSSERDDLLISCQSLQNSIHELEAKKQIKPERSEKPPLGRFRRTDAKPPIEDKVIPLTELDAIEEEIDSKLFDNKNAQDDGFAIPTAPASDNLFQSTKANRLRKFKGHKKIEDIEAKEKDLDEKIRENLEIEQNQEMISHEHPLGSLEEEKPEEKQKEKAYSPNRSFMDLLEDNERRKDEQAPTDLESQWDELDSLEKDELIEEKSSIKPLIYGGTAAGLVIGSAIWFFYLGDKGGKTHSGRNGRVPKPIEQGSSAVPDNSGVPNIDKATQEKLNIEMISVLEKYSQEADPKLKAAICRVPHRTLRDIKLFKATNRVDFVPEKVLSTRSFKKNSINFIAARVEGKLDDLTKEKTVYFEKTEDGKLLLDWHNYVKFEQGPWDNFYNMTAKKESLEWHVILAPDQSDHMDFPEAEYACFKVRSWNPNAENKAIAFLKKSNPMYQQLMDEYYDKDKKQRKFILKLHHTNDGSNSMVIDEVVSLSEFYLTDIDSPVSSSIDDKSFGEYSSY